MKELTLKLTIEEANTILSALGQVPYAQVFGLISKINEQAEEQLRASQNGAPAAKAALENGKKLS